MGFISKSDSSASTSYGHSDSFKISTEFFFLVHTKEEKATDKVI